MSPALNDGDRIVALSWWPQRYLYRNQMILLKPVYATLPDKHPLPASSKQIHIKRIVALAGETIITSLTDVREDTRLRVARYHDEQGKRTWLIPPRHLFVRGDNHMNSADSLVAGPLPWESVCGVVLLKLPCTFSLFLRRKDHASTL